VLYFEEYASADGLRERLTSERENIQCIVSASGWVEEAIPFGTAQQPDLWDYADGVDTMDFLLGLYR
jgi:hypothetical protein